MLTIIFAATIMTTGHSKSQGAACTVAGELRHPRRIAVPAMLL